METIYTADLQASKSLLLREQGKTIGFVPTMGALHEGHLSLIRISKQQNDITVVSIFVNPTQFNDKNDLKNYPRNTERDLALLKKENCDFVFLPDEKEIYPEPDTRVFNFGGLDNLMEGRHRPGHFNGVAQVVTRLFDLVLPHKAYFGLKDFQQLAIIKKVVKDLKYPVEIVPCPIVREADGLAMSSRNALLTPEERKQSLIISKTLFEAKLMKESSSPDQIRDFVVKQIENSPGTTPEYFEIINGDTLQPIENWSDSSYIIGCVAVKTVKIRLIDNISFSS